jgi:hypothetical protein
MLASLWKVGNNVTLEIQFDFGKGFHHAKHSNSTKIMMVEVSIPNPMRFHYSM